MRWTEDKVAIADGSYVLLLGSIVFMALPLLDIYSLEATDVLKATSVKLNKWSYNPLAAFELKWFGLFFLLLTTILGMGASGIGGRFLPFARGF